MKIPESTEKYGSNNCWQAINALDIKQNVHLPKVIAARPKKFTLSESKVKVDKIYRTGASKIDGLHCMLIQSMALKSCGSLHEIELAFNRSKSFQLMPPI
ncbi:hypothetical protein LOAG_00549 [Loa loa]|uniref:Uncharacterized protein n=1 Tax=Loa loa TaxID=7209 RepID=A0A1S0UBG2_LOALO|nr:hypothetical protein LOAG_00549 [Loa loa]EFO27935.1 hypothetical protein LOAG_00549 [Loa loa]